MEKSCPSMAHRLRRTVLLGDSLRLILIVFALLIIFLLFPWVFHANAI